MKFSTLAASLFSVAVFANPLPEFPKPPAEGVSAATSWTCTITGDGVRYRTCPNTKCPAMGQYPKGKRVTFTCYKVGETIGDTEYVPTTIWDSFAKQFVISSEASEPLTRENLSYWDKSTDGYYTTEAYISSSCAENVITRCP